MNRLFAIGLAIAVLTASACSENAEPSATVGPEESATVAELDGAVRSAAAALLNAPGLRVATVYFDFADPEEVVRFDWLEYQSVTDYLVVTSRITPMDSEATMVVAGEAFSAGSTASWAALGPPTVSPNESVEVLVLLAAMAEQTTQSESVTQQDQEVTRQQDSDGNTLWTLITPGTNPETIALGSQWIVGADGALKLYRIGSETEPISGASGIVYEFGVADDLERREPPPLNTPLDLEALDIPVAIEGFNNQE